MKFVYLLYCLSGFISLAYQVAWFRIFSDQFGATNLTFGLVVATFIGGLAVGSLISRRLTTLLGAVIGQPSGLRIYGLVELLVTVSAALTLLLPLLHLGGSFPYQLQDGIYGLTWTHQLLKGAAAVFCIFAPCFFMGVTFPLLCDTFQSDARFPARLYGFNTLGACLAVLACEFLFLPSIGHGRTLLTMLALNAGLGGFFLVAGGAAWLRAPSPAETAAAAAGSVGADDRRTEPSLPLSLAIACGVISGAITGGLEADLFKRIYFYGYYEAVSMSFISFWAILAIFLASWSVAAFRWLNLQRLQGAVIISFLIYLGTNQFAYPIRDWVEVVIGGAGYGYLQGLLVVLLFSGVFVFPTFYLLSLLLPYVCNALQADRRHLGLVYGLNTFAFCSGMIAFTWLAPRVNAFYSFKLFLFFFGILALLLLALNIDRPVALWKPAVALLAVAGACAATPTRFDPSFFPPGDLPRELPVRAMKSNAAHTTFIVEDPRGDVLYFDSHQMSGTWSSSQRYMRLMAHFPLLAQAEPRRALLICFGVGNTASAIASHEELEQIDVVDLNEKVLETAPEFAEINHNVMQDPRLRAIHDDGRHYLSRSEETYDLITSEPPPPLNAGVYRLFSEEYYRQALAHLTPGGMMTQWLPTHETPLPVMERMISTFIHVFPHSLLFVGHNEALILVGSRQPISLANIETRFYESSRVQADLASVQITNPLEVLARVMHTNETLHEEFSGFPRISDQRNDFSRFSRARLGAPAVSYDPRPVLSLLETAGLSPETMQVLRRSLLHLGWLKTIVRDFPDGSLASVPSAAADEVVLAGADWPEIGAHLEASSDYSFAAVEADQQGNSAEAIANARQAIAQLEAAQAITNQLPLAWDDLVKLHAFVGDHLVRSGQLEAGLASYEEALRIDPSHEATLAKRAAVLTQLGLPTS